MSDSFFNYHLAHPGGDNHPADPNAAFYLDGTYHLHYIVAHPWQGKQSYSYAHVTSPDMLHWTWQPTQLQPSFTSHGMFSGTGFLTRAGEPAIIYHGQGSGRNFITVARDRALSAWHPPVPLELKTSPGQPHAPDLDWWDPDCFQVGDYYYAINGGKQPQLMRSPDLKEWTWLGDFLGREMSDTVIGEDVSCPNFFPIGDRWMLLCVSHSLGCRYYLGDWDAERQCFLPTRHGRMNWRRESQGIFGFRERTDYFAPETVLTPDGRRVMWAWLHTAGHDAALANRSVQSLPRELSLGGDGQLRIAPLRELADLRREASERTDLCLSAPVTKFMERAPPPPSPHWTLLAELEQADACELEITVPRQDALRKLFGFRLVGDKAAHPLTVLLRPETGTLRVGDCEAPFSVAELPSEEDLQLRIYIDNGLVEVFVNSRQAMAATVGKGSRALRIEGFTVGTATPIRRLRIWRIAPTNQGFYEARASTHWHPDSGV